MARWSESAGCAGILVYTDNRLVDPWLVSQMILENTTQLCPLVAIQPVYMHPYTRRQDGRELRLPVPAPVLAQHGRRRLQERPDRARTTTTPHDERYERLVEYTLIVKQLLAAAQPVTFEGALLQGRAT